MPHFLARLSALKAVGIPAILLFFAAIVPGAADIQHNTCDIAAQKASRSTDVPLKVLQTITRVETGRSYDGVVRPWPWAINRAGEGFWFDNQDAALAFAFKQVKSGVRNFDVGCFQVNYRWHGHAFSSVEDMFDPMKNALYAANFLQDLFDELGDWEVAAGAYHSRTKTLADKYKKRFRHIQATLPDSAGNGLHRRTRGPGSLISDELRGRKMPGSLVSLPSTQQSSFSFFE